MQNLTIPFLNKNYGYGVQRPNADKRYPVIMIMLWIYSDFMFNVRKFLKKNSKKLKEYLDSKNANEVRISKTHLTSLAFAYFIHQTKPDRLEKAKLDYEKYFEDMLKQFFILSNRDAFYSKSYYKSHFCDYLSSKIKPYRWIHVKYDCFENFDEIIDKISNPIPVDDDSDDV